MVIIKINIITHEGVFLNVIKINNYKLKHKNLKSGNGSLNFLQSVKEEECEDEADENDNVGTQVVRTHHKPCKRSRVV